MSTSRSARQAPPDRGSVRHLAAELLASPRSLTPQVLQYLLSHHDVAEGQVAAWLEKHAPLLESYELDLLLSPLFTPDFETLVRFESALGEGCLTGDDVDELIEELVSSGIRMTLEHDDWRVETQFPDVVVERFVRLLHLDSELPHEILSAFGPLHAEVRCSLRDRVWHRKRSRELLPALLAAARTLGEDFPDFVRFLTDFVRSHRPRSREECATFLDNLARAYEDDLQMHETGSRPFFNEELRRAHAGRWLVKGDVVSAHKRMIHMARALREALRA